MDESRTLSKGSKAGLLLVVLTLMFTILPWLISGYWLRLITSVFMYIVVAKSIDLMMGYTGYVAFGNVVFFGLGAYSAGVAMAHGFGFISSLIIGAILSAVLCLFVGPPVLRLRGHYFAVATIGLNGAVMTIALNSTNITGGAMGLSFPIMQMEPGTLYKYFYFMMFVLMLVTMLIQYWLIKSRFGFAIRSIKSNEEAARSLGINTTYYKTATWVMSAVLTSFAGSIYGYWMSYISTADAFNINISLNAILMALIGGTGTFLGPVVGAFIFQILSETIWSLFLTFHLGMLGIVTIVVIYYMPNGLFYAGREWMSARRHKSEGRKNLESR
jgi:branched-chain amino acid transport system permease protein